MNYSKFISLISLFLLPISTSAQTNYSLEFDGVDDMVVIPDDLLLYNEPRTVSAWIRFVGDLPTGTILASFTANGEYRIEFETTSEIQWVTKNQ